MATPPVLADVKTFLGVTSSYSDDEVQEALDAEIVAQAAVVRLPLEGAYPADLLMALYRRVQRSLNMKGNPLGYQQSATDFGQIQTRIGSDPEIRRLEAPYRRLVLG